MMPGTSGASKGDAAEVTRGLAWSVGEVGLEVAFARFSVTRKAQKITSKKEESQAGLIDAH